MSFIEKYNILKEKIESGDYSFIGLNHQFFQIILNMHLQMKLKIKKTSLFMLEEFRKRRVLKI